jgi:hypothetical protein
MELRLPERPKALQQVEFRRPVRDARFAPDGERVYVLTDDGVIHVCNPGMLTSLRARLPREPGRPSKLDSVAEAQREQQLRKKTGRPMTYRPPQAPVV